MLTPREIRAELAHLRANVDAFMRYRSDDARRWLLAEFDGIERRAAAPVVFRMLATGPAGDDFELGAVGDTVRLTSRVVGLRAAWTALRHQRPVETAGFAAPGAANPDSVVRRSIRREAVAFAEQHCPPLVPVLLDLEVSRGRITLRHAQGLPLVIT